MIESLAIAQPIAITRKAGMPQGVIIILLNLVPMLAVAALVPVVPAIVEHFKDVAHIMTLAPMVLAAPGLCVALFSPFAGYLADRLGRRQLLLIFTLLYGIGGILPFFIQSFPILIGGRLLQGVGGAFIFTIGNTLLGDYFDPKDAAKWLTLQSISGTVFGTLLLPFSGYLTTMGWQYPFLIYSLTFVTPSLCDDEKELIRIVNELWKPGKQMNVVGNGKVYTGKSIQQVLSDLKILPDFAYSKPQKNTALLFVHRKLPDGEIYWVNNRNERKEDIEAMFRVPGKETEFWYPETGRTEKASYTIAGDRTKVFLHLEPNEAVFVVFRKYTSNTSITIPRPVEKEIFTIGGSWHVRFQPNRWASAALKFDTLNSWTEHSDAGVKYFSGTATYTKTINVPASWLGKGSQLWFDLGDVKNLAEVAVNGRSMGIVLKKPFYIDVTNALKFGENKLEIKVTNLWVNRLIGDQQPGVTNKITYTTIPFYKAEATLLPSGLLGPVKLLQRQ
jgi:hypothetical protein